MRIQTMARHRPLVLDDATVLRTGTALSVYDLIDRRLKLISPPSLIFCRANHFIISCRASIATVENTKSNLVTHAIRAAQNTSRFKNQLSNLLCYAASRLGLKPEAP
jgi:hypothetical protein